MWNSSNRQSNYQTKNKYKSNCPTQNKQHVPGKKDTMNNQLQPCTTCYSSTQMLIKKRTNFAVNLEIIRDNCITEQNKMSKQVQ